jgi:hypothetical protein
MSFCASSTRALGTLKPRRLILQRREVKTPSTMVPAHLEIVEPHLDPSHKR